MTRKIKVGNVYIGGGAPISVQSMCNTKTADVENTIKQIISLQYRAFCRKFRVRCGGDKRD